MSITDQGSSHSRIASSLARDFISHQIQCGDYILFLDESQHSCVDSENTKIPGTLTFIAARRRAMANVPEFSEL